MADYRIAAIGGDGIGPEVVRAGIEVLRAAEQREGGFSLTFETFPWGSDYYFEHSRMMPDDGLETLKPFDAIYFGAVGDMRLPDDVTLWGLRLKICQGFDQYANVRPARVLKGVTSPLRNPGNLDWVIVRENSEGEYSGAGGRVHRGLPEEVAVDASVFTRTGCERIQRFAFELARKRPRKKLTLVTKSNAQRHGMVMWDEIFAALKGDYPDVETDKVLVDAATVRMTLHPDSLDVIVASNLHADILSDLAAALSGSIGVAPTANLNPEGRFPSMFEPIHGSAPDIVGKNVANPIGTFWTAAFMLESLGEAKAGARIMRAVERVTSAGSPLTPDLGGNATTDDVTRAVCEAIAGENE